MLPAGGSGVTGSSHPAITSFVRTDAVVTATVRAIDWPDGACTAVEAVRAWHAPGRLIPFPR
ncbi:hypothetical protein ACIHBQ_31190 [Streptomyces sp. NPDC052492]|uniref:hypothetical protein n=1 Tax=Streptomyces sp. NPDC052492 TaxID=3365691 RepID=UPI0037CE2A9B